MSPSYNPFEMYPILRPYLVYGAIGLGDDGRQVLVRDPRVRLLSRQTGSPDGRRRRWGGRGRPLLLLSPAPLLRVGASPKPALAFFAFLDAVLVITDLLWLVTS